MNPEITPESIAAILPGTFPGDMAIEPLEITDEHAVGRLIVDRRHLHPGGFVHGGVWVALADSVAAWGTFRHLPPGHGFTTIELKLNALAAGVLGDELIATAVPLHTGRRTQVWEVKVHRGERLVADFTATQMVIAPDERRASPDAAYEGERAGGSSGAH